MSPPIFACTWVHPPFFMIILCPPISDEHFVTFLHCPKMHNTINVYVLFLLDSHYITRPRKFSCSAGILVCILIYYHSLQVLDLRNLIYSAFCFSSLRFFCIALLSFFALLWSAFFASHQSAFSFDLLSYFLLNFAQIFFEIAQTPGLYLVPELRYTCQHCRPCCPGCCCRPMPLMSLMS